MRVKGVVVMNERRADSVPGESFESVYRREFGSVVALAYALSGSRTAAEELAQDSFLAAYRRWEEIGGYEQPAAWVRRVCANRSTSFIRRRMSESRAVARLAERRVLPEQLPPDADAFWATVRRLPRRQAQVVALRYLEDLPVSEIAAVLECSEATVRVQLHRARKRLATLLGCDVDAEPKGLDL